MSMLRNWLTYMGLGPDEDYDDRYLYERGGRGSINDEADPPAPSARSRGVRPRPARVPAKPRTQSRPAPRHGRDSKYSFDDIDLRNDGDGPEMEVPVVPQHQRRQDLELGDSSSAFESDPRRSGDQPRVRPLRAVPSPESDLTKSAFDDDDTSASRSAGGAVTPIRKLDRFVKPELVIPTTFSDAQTVADIFRDRTPVILDLGGTETSLRRRLLDFASGVCYALDGGMERLGPAAYLLIPELVEVSPEERDRARSRIRSS